MRRLFYAVVCVSVFIIGASPARSLAEEGYTFISGDRGPQICVGRWIPSTDVALPGVCDGQMYGLPQLTALSARQTVDKLDQLILVLSSIDDKLAVNNDQITALIEATVNTQNSMEDQARQSGEFLREAITGRFDNLPKEVLSNDLFKETLTKLKEDILAEVEKKYAPRRQLKK